MFQVHDRERLKRSRQMMRGEQLHQLEFADAFRDTLSMMALLINMTQSFASVSEYRRLPSHCGSLPEFHKLDREKNKKNSRRRS